MEEGFDNVTCGLDLGFRTDFVMCVSWPLPFFFFFDQTFTVIFAPTELKVKARTNTLNVTWHPSPNHTLVSGYKLSCREVETDELAKGERIPQTHTVRLRKKARYHLLTGMRKL